MDLIFMLSILLCWTFIINIDFAHGQEDPPIIKVTAPINPVREDAMISIHCQIWNKVEGQEVTMSRKLKGAARSQRLSWDEKVQNDDDDRIFLAERRLTDGSVVYFLSIIEVTQSDEGTYFCKIVYTEENDM